MVLAVGRDLRPDVKGAKKRASGIPEAQVGAEAAQERRCGA